MLEKNKGECKLFPECVEVYGDNCAKCAPGYVIGDGEKNEDGIPLKVCKAVSDTVDHCEEYEVDGLCAECESGYRLHNDVITFKRAPDNEKQCVAWPNEIHKCKTHFEDNEKNSRCLECEAGYMLNEKMNRCEEHRDENCLISSNIGCDECFSGYGLQEYSLNLVPPHLEDYSVGINILHALLSNRKRSDLIRCRPRIPYCVKYITISSFDNEQIKNVKNDPNEEYISDTEENDEGPDTDNERLLLLKKAETRKLFEIKFGDDEHNKWIIGISKGRKHLTKKDGGEVNKDFFSNDKREATRESDEGGLIQNGDGDIVTCGRCTRGYFLYQVEPLRFECMEAQYIEHCEEYLDRNNCYLCDKHYYLKDGKCVPIEAKNFVDHCQYYSEDQDCLICENEYALLRMIGMDSQDPEVTDKFHETHPYMQNHVKEEKVEQKNSVKMTQKTFGEVVEIEGRKYQKVEQMNITQLMTHVTFKEYIEGKKTMDDVAQAKIGSLGVHYDLSALHLNFENENSRTKVFEKDKRTDEEIQKRNQELGENIQKAKQTDADEDVRVETKQNLVDEQVIEKQVITEDSQDSDQDFEQKPIVEEGSDMIPNDEDSEILDDKSVKMNANKKEEDVVVLAGNKEEKRDGRARKLFDLFNIFSFGSKKAKKKKIKSWSLNGKRKLLRKIDKGRILEEIKEKEEKRKLLEGTGSNPSEELSSPAVHSEEVISTSTSEHVATSQKTIEQAVHSEVNLENDSDALGDHHSSPSISHHETSINTDVHLQNHSEGSISTQTNIIPEKLRIDKDNGVVLLSESESVSHGTDHMTPISETKDSKASGDSAEEKDSNASDETSSDSQSTSEESDLGTESERLKKVYDSKHIVMESPEDLKKRQIKKDKQILDRMFDRESGNEYVDPDKLADQKQKIQLIHDIINHSTVDLTSPSDHSQSDKTPKAFTAGKKQMDGGLFDGVNLDGTGINGSENQANNIQQQPIITSESTTKLKDFEVEMTSDQKGSKVQSSITSKEPKTTGAKEEQIDSLDRDSVIKSEIQKVMIKRSLCIISNSIANCSAHYRGDCIECETDYHLINNICKPLAEEKKVMFCKAYNQDQKCIRCKSGFVLVAGHCLKFKEVVNCKKQVYYPNGKCLICKNGFYYDEEEKKCISREQKYFKEKHEQEMEGKSDQGNLDEEDIGFDRNCLLVRNNSDKSCFMCRPNYYMDKKGSCLYSDDGYSKRKWFVF